MPKILRAPGTSVITWIAIGSINYDKEQMEFLLPLLPGMMAGDYPTEPAESGGSSPGVRASAPYEAVCQVAAEISRRLAMTSDHRYLLQLHYFPSIDRGDGHLDGLSFREIAKETNSTARRVEGKVSSVLNYISSGSCPRWLSCRKCGTRDDCQKEKKGRSAQSYQDYRNNRKDWRKQKR